MRLASLIVLAFSLSILKLSAADSAHPKTLEQYEAIRTALVADNLGATKKAATALVTAVKEESATELQDASVQLANSTSLKEARAAFQKLSITLEKWVKGKKGYFIATCPMIEGSVWIQTTEKIGNPYAGKEMPECGMIKK